MILPAWQIATLHFAIGGAVVARGAWPHPLYRADENVGPSKSAQVEQARLWAPFHEAPSQ